MLPLQYFIPPLRRGILDDFTHGGKLKLLHQNKTKHCPEVAPYLRHGLLHPLLKRHIGTDFFLL